MIETNEKIIFCYYPESSTASNELDVILMYEHAYIRSTETVLGRKVEQICTINRNSVTNKTAFTKVRTVLCQPLTGSPVP